MPRWQVANLIVRKLPTNQARLMLYVQEQHSLGLHIDPTRQENPDNWHDCTHTDYQTSHSTRPVIVAQSGAWNK